MNVEQRQGDRSVGESLFSYFDRTYVINLEQRTDRKREMLENFARLGIAPEASSIHFFPAIRPDSPAGFRTLGARGCFLSHLGVLKDAQQRGLDRILIFEDDLDFTPDFASRVDDVVTALQQTSWGVFYGGHEVPSFRPTETRTLHVIPQELGVICNHFIGFSKPHIGKLVDYLEAMLERESGHPEGGPMDVDGAYSWYRGATPECVTVGCFPPIGVQRPSRTDISDTRWFDRFPLLSGPLRQLRRIKHKLK